MPRKTSSGLLVLAILFLASPGRTQEGPSLGLSAGLFDLAAWTDEDGDFDSVEAGLQFRGAADWFWGTGPVLGVAANEDDAFWTWAGLRRPFFPGERWLVVPSFAVSYYEAGDGKDLGHEVEFRSGLELAFRFDGGSSLGLELYHLSNASLSDTNPGTNNLVLVWSLPLGH